MKITDPVTNLPYVGESYAQKLKRLNIYTIEDLLHHVPHRLLDYTNVLPIKALKIGEEASVVGEIISISNFRSKNGKAMQAVKITDGRDTLDVIWVNQPFITKIFKKGDTIQLFGKLKFWGRKKAFIFPKFEKITKDKQMSGKIVSVYSETEGIKSGWISQRAKDALGKIDKIDDFIPPKDLVSLDLMDLHEAFINVHDTDNKKAYKMAVKRLAFNELLLFQLQKAFERIKWKEQNKSLRFKDQKSLIDIFNDSLPFKLTSAQQRSILEIYEDLKRDYPMNRLLMGDVGSGKTVVAAFAMFISFASGHQSVLMAPTQVLAQQHYKNIKALLKHFETRISLYTGSKEMTGFGKADVIIGTHALLHRPHLFEKTGVVVIDEQHRFGVRQRAQIVENTKTKNHTPHILSMTATPIPRTITLTMYGDLEISKLDEMPVGRKPVKTWVVPKKKRKKAYKWIKEQVQDNGIQAFVVCPFIEESDRKDLQMVKAAKEEYEKIKKILPELSVGLLHGKLKAQEKDRVLDDFRNRKYDILVTTPVVEVGIDIPNATIMMIEAAERFGLAQLHQLRGRVGRSDMKSFCFLFTESKSPKARKRLKLMEEHNSGQKLAELDLRLRGPGEIFGVRQSGLPELKIASWEDVALAKKSKKYAQQVAEKQDKYENVIDYYKRKQIASN